MKKYLFIALSAFAAFSFTACEKKGGDTPGQEDPQGDITITVSPESLTMSVGDEQRLKATVAPAGTTLTIKWESSNPEVASVSSSGLVEAVAEGEAVITASAEGAKSGSCKVVVSDNAIYDAFAIADWGLFGETEYVEGSDTVLTWSDGTSDTCQIGYNYLITWDGDLLYVSGSGFTGAGFAIMVPVPIYWITKGEWAGYYVGAGGFVIDGKPGEIRPYHAEAGSVDVDNYGKFLKTYFVAETSEDVDWEAMEAAFPGAHIIYIDGDNSRWSSDYGQYYGHIDYADLTDANEAQGIEMSYYGKLHWYDFTSDDRYLGMKIQYNADSTELSVVEPFDMLTIEKDFASENAVIEEAPVHYSRGDMARYHKEMPALGKYVKSTVNFVKK